MRVFFPAVASGAGNVDFYFVMNAPSFTDWGKIWDAYSDYGREVGVAMKRCEQFFVSLQLAAQEFAAVDIWQTVKWR